MGGVIVISSLLWSLGLLLLVSGVAKLGTRVTDQSALNVLALPAVLDRRPIRAALPWVEILLALALVLGAGPLLGLVTGITTVVFAAFTGFVAHGVRRGDPVSCGCFGALSRAPISWRTVARNIVLTLLALTAFIATALGGYGGPAFGPSWDALGAISVPVLVLAVIAWAERGGGVRASNASVAAVPPLPAGPRVPATNSDGTYHRLPVPYATVVDAAGNRVSLRAACRRQARALIAVSPSCAPCGDVIHRLEQVPDHVGPVALHAMVSRPEFVAELPDVLRANALVDPDGALAQTFDVPGTPWAVVLGADELLAGGPEVGGDTVGQLLDELVERFTPEATS